MKNQLSLPILCLFAILFFGCETAPQKSPPKKEQKETTTVAPVENKSTAPLSRFQNEIDNFIKEDKENGFSKNGILMTGSSSIRMWKSMDKDFPNLPVLNRGFGGATIPEVLHFAGKYIFQHEPQIIVFYCGENDISEGVSPETVFASFKAFVKIIELRLPETKLVYISMKPSVARWNLWEKYQAGEKLIKDFVNKNPKIEYMDATYECERLRRLDGAVKTYFERIISNEIRNFIYFKIKNKACELFLSV